MATRTLEQLDAIAAIRAEINVARTLVLSESAPRADRELAQERLSLLTARLLEVDATPPEPEPERIVDLATTRDAAADRARAIREDPRFWNQYDRDADGRLKISAEDHAKLRQELRECDALAASEGDAGGGES